MPLRPGELEPLLRLALVRGVGPHRYAALIERFGSPEGVLGASGPELERLPGLGPVLARELLEAGGPAGTRRVSSALGALERVGAAALTPDDPAYPEAFRLLADPPYLVFAAGNLALLSAPAIAIVGTRRPTHYGRDTTAALSNGLAYAGYTIVSGMARGIDTVAHRAALEAGGCTVGVLGHGIDQVYPPENRALFSATRARGLLLTEMPPGERPLAGNFPRRNRLIAALSRAVLVVEMGLKSGAQHTVTYALELGKDVLAVPGPVDSPASEGANQLIKDGARLVTSVEDVLEEIRGVGTAPVGRGSRESAAPAQPVLIRGSAEEERILGVLSAAGRHIDQIAGETGLSPGSLLGLLLEMEMKGAVEALPGQRYRRR